MWAFEGNAPLPLIQFLLYSETHRKLTAAFNSTILPQFKCHRWTITQRKGSSDYTYYHSSYLLIIIYHHIRTQIFSESALNATHW